MKYIGQLEYWREGHAGEAWIIQGAIFGSDDHADGTQVGFRIYRINRVTREVFADDGAFRLGKELS